MLRMPTGALVRQVQQISETVMLATTTKQSVLLIDFADGSIKPLPGINGPVRGSALVPACPWVNVCGCLESSAHLRWSRSIRMRWGFAAHFVSPQSTWCRFTRWR